MTKWIIFLALRVGIRAYYTACVQSLNFSDLSAVPQYINAASKDNFYKVSFYSLYFNGGIIGIISLRKQKREREKRERTYVIRSTSYSFSDFWKQSLRKVIWETKAGNNTRILDFSTIAALTSFFLTHRQNAIRSSELKKKK